MGCVRWRSHAAHQPLTVKVAHAVRPSLRCRRVNPSYRDNRVRHVEHRAVIVATELGVTGHRTVDADNSVLLVPRGRLKTVPSSSPDATSGFP